MHSGNKYTSRSSLGSAIYGMISNRYQTTRRLFICFSRMGKKVTKMCFSKGGNTLKVCNKNMFDKT